MKSAILYETPENDCEGINCEAMEDSATYITFKQTTNDNLMYESETGF